MHSSVHQTYKPPPIDQHATLKVKKAASVDRIPACLLKDSAAVITQTVTFLVNFSLTAGIVPDEWKQAKVIPLHKFGGREAMDKYQLDLTSNLKNCCKKGRQCSTSTALTLA